MQTHTLATTRTARYYTLSPPSPSDSDAPSSVWIVCHGYGQLARFAIRPFRPIAALGHTVVAPEALSRFYLDRPDGTHERVGASWMTRESRETEIADQVNYLDTVLTETCGRLGTDPSSVRLTAFGFSQGTATISRWLARSTLLASRASRADRLVLWGGAPAHDLLGTSLSMLDSLSRLPLTLVVGDKDPIVPSSRVDEWETHFQNLDTPYRLMRYPGDHRIDGDVLIQLAKETLDD